MNASSQANAENLTSQFLLALLNKKPTDLDETLESFTNVNVFSSVASVIENRFRAKETYEKVCDQLFTLYRTRSPKARNFVLQFTPILAYSYLDGLTRINCKKEVLLLETLLLGMYNVEVGDKVDEQVFPNFRIPSLAQPSLYHEPLGLAAALLTEAALKRFDPSQRPRVNYGPLPHRETLRAAYRQTVLGLIFRVYGQNLSNMPQYTYTYTCSIIRKIVVQGLTDYEDQTPDAQDAPCQSRLTVDAQLLLELLNIAYSILLSRDTVHERSINVAVVSISALEAIQQRAAYELYPAVLLASQAMLSQAQVDLKGSKGAYRHDSRKGSTLVGLSKSMITNASFRTKKLPDDITVISSIHQVETMEEHKTGSTVLGAINEDKENEENGSLSGTSDVKPADKKSAVIDAMERITSKLSDLPIGKRRETKDSGKGVMSKIGNWGKERKDSERSARYDGAEDADFNPDEIPLRNLSDESDALSKGRSLESDD
nr:EOG090X02H3 [Triops cancriformis]